MAFEETTHGVRCEVIQVPRQIEMEPTGSPDRRFPAAEIRNRDEQHATRAEQGFQFLDVETRGGHVLQHMPQGDHVERRARDVVDRSYDATSQRSGNAATRLSAGLDAGHLPPGLVHDVEKVAGPAADIQKAPAASKPFDAPPASLKKNPAAPPGDNADRPIGTGQFTKVLIFVRGCQLGFGRQRIDSDETARLALAQEKLRPVDRFRARASEQRNDRAFTADWAHGTGRDG